MPSVLIVEDSKVVMKILKHVAGQTLGFDVVFAMSRAEALNELNQRDDWLAAVVDLNLPDAPQGELVDDVLEMGIPTIVLTGRVDQDIRDTLTRKGVVDYVLKEGRFSYQYAVNLVNRLYKNQAIKVLVAEDSTVTRNFIAELLARHLFQVVAVENGKEALDVALSDEQVKIVLTDYNMPVMDGFQLIHELRHKQEKEDLIVIGLSSAGDKYLSAKFIKNGANDFLYKPFSHEEFFCRIMQAVESMERLDRMRKMAYSDSLTGIGNRRLFVQRGRELVNEALDAKTPLSFALMDIDHFKSINDDYGHDVGDEVLVFFAGILERMLGRFFIARTGGEEFCVMFPGLVADRAGQLLEAVREHVSDAFVDTVAGSVSFSVSAGVSDLFTDSLEVLMKEADKLLYQAKDSGRNKIMIGVS